MNKTIKLILLIIGVIVFGFLAVYGIFKGFQFLAEIIPYYISGGMILLGLFLLIVGRRFLRKDLVYKKVSNDRIVLETPLFADLLYLFGILILGFGLLTFQPLFSFLKNDSVFMGFIVIMLFLMQLVMILRLIYALNDSIEITLTSIKYDDPGSRNSLLMEKKNIVELVYLKEFDHNRSGYSADNFSYKLYLKYKKEGAETERIDFDPEAMNLQLDLMIEALNELLYPIQNRAKRALEETEWEGHDFRDEE